MAIRKIIKRATDALFTNPEFDGTEAARQVKGTTAERTSAEAGDLRFNTTTSLMEYYDGSQWKGIDTPPVVSSISPTVETDANATITITGSNFQSGATVKFVGADGTEYASPTVSVVSGTSITATTPSTALSVANEPYDIQVTNTTSGLTGILADALDAGGVPAFNEAAGSLGVFYDTTRTGISVDAGATDPDGDTITYSISSGSLPSGLSLNTSTGAVTGDADAVGSDTTSTFTVSAATASDTSTRQFTIEIKAPVVTSYTSVGSGTFSVPSGITAVDVLVVAGGGGGAVQNGYGGGGGAGGLIYRPAFPVTPSGSVSYTVGGGGQGDGGTGPGSSPSAPYQGTSQSGQDSVFGTLTAQGGGHAGAYSDPRAGGQGGSGGGSAVAPNQVGQTGGQGTQPQQPGDSGTYGFGNPGGSSSPWSPPYSGRGGGGGGAGAAGSPGNRPAPATGGKGGIGKQYDISGSQVYYAGGGSGGKQPAPSDGTSGVPGTQGGGGASLDGPQGGSVSTPQAVANRGGGGGFGYGAEPRVGGQGGSGIIIVKY